MIKQHDKNNSLLKKSSNGHTEFVRGLRASVPVLLGFIPFALALGAQAFQKGFRFFEVPLMTGLNFGGGSEFAAIRLWTSPPHLLLIVSMSFLVNSRHILMGAAFVPYLKHLPKARALPTLFLMCDESWAMTISDAKERGSQLLSLPYYIGVSISLYLTWVVFTASGFLLGANIGDVDRYGFDMAFTAVFLVLLKGMWKGYRASIPWFVSLGVAATFYLTVPGAWYVAAGALSGLFSAFFLGRSKS